MSATNSSPPDIMVRSHKKAPTALQRLLVLAALILPLPAAVYAFRASHTNWMLFAALLVPAVVTTVATRVEVGRNSPGRAVAQAVVAVVIAWGVITLLGVGFPTALAGVLVLITIALGAGRLWYVTALFRWYASLVPLNYITMLWAGSGLFFVRWETAMVQIAAIAAAASTLLVLDWHEITMGVRWLLLAWVPAWGRARLAAVRGRSLAARARAWLTVLVDPVSALLVIWEYLLHWLANMVAMLYRYRPPAHRLRTTLVGLAILSGLRALVWLRGEGAKRKTQNARRGTHTAPLSTVVALSILCMAGRQAIGQGDVLQAGPTKFHSGPLGFEAPYAAGFALDEKGQAMLDKIMGGRNGLWGWGYFHHPPDEVISIYVNTQATFARDSAGFFNFAQNMTKSARTAPGAQVLLETVRWRADTAEYRVAVFNPKANRYLKWRCLASGEKREKPILVCFNTKSPDPTGLDFVREGLVLTPVQREGGGT